jgi:hypothetical protein
MLAQYAKSEEACAAAVVRPAGSTGLQPQRGRWEGRAGGESPVQCCHAVTPQPLGGGRGGVGPGAPRVPCYPSAPRGGRGRRRGKDEKQCPFTTKVGRGLENLEVILLPI